MRAQSLDGCSFGLGLASLGEEIVTVCGLLDVGKFIPHVRRDRGEAAMLKVRLAPCLVLFPAGARTEIFPFGGHSQVLRQRGIGFST